MAITSIEKVFIVEDSEYGWAPSQMPVAGGGNIVLNIPKIMGNLSGTGPDTLSADGIFDNDDECKINYSKSISRDKYVTCQLEKNGLWMAHLTGGGAIREGDRFRVHFLNGNIHSPKATTS